MISDYPNFHAPIVGQNGLISDAWWRRLQLQREQLNVGFFVVGSTGLLVDGSPVGPGETLALTNTGVTSLVLTQPAAGLTITNSGVSQTLGVSSTFALANDLAAVEGLETFGFAARTAADTWVTRTLTGTADNIDITDGTGIAADPVVSISGTYPGQTSITTLGTVTTGTWTGDTIAILNGGTGQTTANEAFNALAPSQTANSGKFLQTDGTNTSWVATTVGTVTSVAMTVPAFLSIAGSPITSSGTLAVTLSGTALPVLNGGTGVTTSTGTGSAVLSNTPTLVTPVLGVATGTSVVLTSSATASAFIPSASTVPTNGVYLPAANTVGLAANSTQVLKATSTLVTLPISTATSGTASILVAGSGALGYGTGSGGTVTQATSKSTGVTLNKSNGRVVMNGAALAANTSVAFTLTNSTIAATDVVSVTIASGATSLAYITQVQATAAGSCSIAIRNVSAGSLSEAVTLNFVVIKAVTA